jgi:hypothetical protein
MNRPQTNFSLSRELRDRFCKNKDKVLVPLLKALPIPDPQSFHAILMPSLYGIEARYLVSQGVPPKNIFAIEDNSAEFNFDVHAEIVRCALPDRREMKGMKTTSAPARVTAALDEAWYAFNRRPVDLIYLDFLSQPDYEVHYKQVLGKIFRVPMLAHGATLIVNFGKSRCREEPAAFNRRLSVETGKIGIRSRFVIQTEALIGAASKQAGVRLACKPESHSYVSHRYTYVTTVVKVS